MSEILWGDCMRVISGRARGRKLVSLEGLLTRPTTDRVKESIFNIISPYIPAGRVLDLFAGSGALGVEALSRGSAHCTFVEANKDAMAIVKKNIELTRSEDCSSTIFGDALSFLNRCTQGFDVIFLDPPYNTGLLKKAVELIGEKNLLLEDGIILCESEAGGEEPPADIYKIIKQAKYGKTTVFVLKNTP